MTSQSKFEISRLLFWLVLILIKDIFNDIRFIGTVNNDSFSDICFIRIDTKLEELYCDIIFTISFSPSLNFSSQFLWGDVNSRECPPCWACCSSASSQRGRHPPHSASWPFHTRCYWHRRLHSARLRFYGSTKQTRHSCFTLNPVPPENALRHVQTVHDCSALSLLSFTLPLVHLKDQLEEGAFGGGDFPMPRPSQVLELTDHQVALLRLKDQKKRVKIWTDGSSHRCRNAPNKKNLLWPWWGCRLWRAGWWRHSPLSRTCTPPGPDRNAACPPPASTEDNPEKETPFNSRTL